MGSVASLFESEVDFAPIHSAIRWNKSISEIAKLLTSDAAVNCQDKSNGNCPVHIAAQNGHTDIIILLISRHANLNAQNAKGNTALHMAISYDFYEVARAMLAAGADENIQNEMGIPAHLGLDGDKSLGIAALVCAETGKDVYAAFDLCEAKIASVNQINFIAAGLKAKKALGSSWTTDHQIKFKDITNRLSSAKVA